MKSRVGSKIFVRSFPGAKVADFADYTKPSLRQNPKKIIVHAGTNDILHKTPRHVAESLVDITQMIETELNDASCVAISGLIFRDDHPDVNEKISAVNKNISKFCNDRGWGFISNENIDPKKSLDNSGLHLNRSGTGQLVSNFLSYLS